MRELRYILGVAILLFASCQSDLGTENFFNLEDEYELYVTQELSSKGGLASLEVRSSQELDCSNYTIPYALAIESDHISLTFDNVSIEGDCIPDPSHASQTINFKLDTDVKDIVISLQEVVSNSGKLNVTEDEISLELTSKDGLKINKAKINRIQTSMMWGKIFTDNTETVDLINNYFDSIKTSKEILQGDYGYFYINNSNSLQYYDAASTSLEPHTFALFSEMDIATIEEKILEIKESDPTLVFQMTIYDGQTINII